jgi:hypothetical protein
VSTEQGNGRYRTIVEAPKGLRLTLGHTLPEEVDVVSVTLDGSPAEYEIVDTLRGREVRVETTSGAPHTLVITGR